MKPDPSFPEAYRGTLCHPDGLKSCGACCGVYNFRNASRDDTIARLASNTLKFEGKVASDEGALEFAEVHRVADDSKLLEGLENCHFLGFLDHDGAGVPAGRIGCLVHPTRHQGWDGREFGVYDQDTCEDYLCGAHQLLREREKWLVIRAIKDSYLYGLVITDVRFVRELFERAADHLGETVDWGMLNSEQAWQTAGRYFELKTDWPYITHDSIFGLRHAGSDLETPRREPPNVEFGVDPDPIDTILTCLGTYVSSVDDLDTARGIARSRVLEFAEAVRR